MSILSRFLRRPPEPLAKTEPPPAPPPPPLYLTAHIEATGDRQPNADGWVGRAGGHGCIEGFTLASDFPGWRDAVRMYAVLHDGSLGPATAGGAYCGTRGRNLPVHGVLIEVDPDIPALAHLTCEAVFQDGYRSPGVPPGQPCVSPTGAALLALRISHRDAPSRGPEGWDGRPYWLPPPCLPDAPAEVAEAEDIQAAPAAALVAAPDVEPVPCSLIAHVANAGDTGADADGWVGVSGAKGRIEGFAFSSPRPGWHQDVSYQCVLKDGELGPVVAGGDYCGTRGKAMQIYGFVVNVPGNATDVAGVFYEGVFEDGHRSGPLHAGERCVSPKLAPLVALRLSAGAAVAPRPENVRAVIWDLDETFWDGTLSEGGITWREDHAEIVRTLSRRGIINTICSKNDPSRVIAELEAHGMREYFVLPSISWDPKGPRLAALVEALQLRAPTLLFIDDNPMNRAEAAMFVPGLQVHDETVVPELLGHPLLQGKADPEMTRLAQYRVLERRVEDQAKSAGDTTAFLRASGIVVSIEHDLGPHIDRAVELINRTNQLNFTKVRLREQAADPEVARAELRGLLARHDVQAGILRVRDNYGDYGYCGLYVNRRSSGGGDELLHFAFSCRILGMGVETWLYRRLNRPRLNVVGPVVADVFDESREIDWIGTELPGVVGAADAKTKRLSYVLARGACDMRALSHYFGMVSERVIEEFDEIRRGQGALINHSLIAAQAMNGIDPRAVADFAPFGYDEGDFATVLAGELPPGPAVWVLGFTIEQPVPVYRHKETGALLPTAIQNFNGNPALMMRGGPADGADPAVIAHLREKFEFFAKRPDDRLDEMLRESLRLIFSRAGEDVRIFVLLGNVCTLHGDGTMGMSEWFRYHNGVIAEVAAEFPRVELLSPASFMTRGELTSLAAAHHFDRIVYYRIFRHIMDRVG